MKKVVVPILTGILLLTGCGGGGEPKLDAKEATKVMINGVVYWKDSSNSSKIKAIIDRLSLSKMVILITHDTNIVENAVAKFSIKEKQIYQMN